jgi:DNA-directed RNA polymerase specialized sigma24 family protein
MQPSPVVPPLGSVPESHLVELVRSGDRVAGAEFLRRNHDVLRQRIRRRLRRVGRRLFDSQEILSTVCRRLDRMVSHGTVRAIDPAALMRLVVEIADHSVVDKARVLDRIRRVEGPDSELAASLRSRIEEGEHAGVDGGEDVIARIFEKLDEQQEREILGLWLRGCPLVSIAQELETSPAAMRKRWEKIRRRCLAVLAQGAAA